MDEQKKPDISLVDLIERERNALGSTQVRQLPIGLLAVVWRCMSRIKSICLCLFVSSFVHGDATVHQTKVTLESFLAWKKRKIQEKKDTLAKEEEQKRKDYKSGKQFGLSGREMFSFNPSLATDNDLEDDDGAYASYEREDDDNDNVTEYRELDLDALAAVAQEVGHFAPVMHMQRNARHISCGLANPIG